MSLMELKMKSKSANENEIVLMCTKCFNLIRVPKMVVSVKMEYDTRDHNVTSISPTKGDLLISPRRMINYLELCHDCHVSKIDPRPGKLAMIDNGIADSVQLFNKKGYITNMCCEGHYEMTPGGNYYSMQPYISFRVSDEKQQNAYVDAISAALKDIKTEYEGSVRKGDEDAKHGDTKSVYYQQISNHLSIVNALEHIECTPFNAYNAYVDNKPGVIVRYGICNINALLSNPYETFRSLMYSVAMRVAPIKKEK